MRFWQIGFVLALALIEASCGETTNLPPEIIPGEVKTITLKLRFKDSCASGFICNYDASCMSAVQLIAKRTSDNSEIGKSCTPLGQCEDCLSPRLDVLCDMIFGQVIANLPSISLEEDFYLEVRGLHDSAGDADVCAQPSTSKWLMWGETASLDVKALSSRTVAEALVECRYCDGGCSGLDSLCPLEMPISNCLPSLSCNKNCDASVENSCFDGALECSTETGKCVVPVGQIGFCSPCSSRADCAPMHHCIADIGASSGFCASTCPQETCPSGAHCQPIGSGTSFQELP